MPSIPYLISCRGDCVLVDKYTIMLPKTTERPNLHPRRPPMQRSAVHRGLARCCGVGTPQLPCPAMSDQAHPSRASCGHAWPAMHPRHPLPGQPLRRSELRAHWAPSPMCPQLLEYSLRRRHQFDNRLLRAAVGLRRATDSGKNQPSGARRSNVGEPLQFSSWALASLALRLRFPLLCGNRAAPRLDELMLELRRVVEDYVAIDLNQHGPRKRRS